MSTIFDCSVLQLSKIHNRAGNITVVENFIHVPFSIQRIYYLYDIPSSAKRGGHSHKNLIQILIAISGSFDVVLHDGISSQTVTLNKPDKGLLIKSNIWRELENFSSGAVCLVLASEVFLEADYIRDFNTFLKQF